MVCKRSWVRVPVGPCAFSSPVTPQSHELAHLSSACIHAAMPIVFAFNLKIKMKTKLMLDHFCISFKHKNTCMFIMGGFAKIIFSVF